MFTLLDLVAVLVAEILLRWLKPQQVWTPTLLLFIGNMVIGSIFVEDIYDDCVVINEIKDAYLAASVTRFCFFHLDFFVTRIE